MDYIDDETIILNGESVIYSLKELTLLSDKYLKDNNIDGILKLHYLKKEFNGKIVEIKKSLSSDYFSQQSLKGV